VIADLIRLGLTVFLIGLVPCAMVEAALPQDEPLPGKPVILEPDAAGRFGVKILREPGFYYRLWRSGTPGAVGRCVGLHLGGVGSWEVRDPLPMARQGYYRIEKLPLQVPLDADGDGRDDVVELRRQPTFSALNPALPMDVEDGAVFLPDRPTNE